jgi:hypothetical protein
MARKGTTIIVAFLFAAVMWLFVWPAFRPYINIVIPLPGKSEISAVSVNFEPTGKWMASVDYFFTGRPDGASLTIVLNPATDTQVPFYFDQFQRTIRAVRGAHRANIEIERPAFDDDISTNRVTVRLMDESKKREISSKSIDVTILWPDSKIWALDKEIASTPREISLKKAIGLLDAGDTRSLVQAKWILERLIYKDANYTPAIEQMLRLASSASWTPQGIVRLDTVAKIRDEVNALENERAYVELDEMALHLRETKSVTLDGYSALRAFHKALNGDYFSSPELTPKTLEALERKGGEDSLQNGWTRKLPDSPAPKIRIAKTLQTAAWQIRGTGLANTVSEEKWRRVSSLMGKAREQLIKCRHTCDADPEWYATLISVIRTSSTDRSDIPAAFVEGFTKFPEYAPIYWEMAASLSPKWGGSVEAVESFAKELSSKFSPAEADAVYADLYSELIYRGDAFFDPQASALKVDCARWIRGREKIISKFPTTHNYNVAASTSVRCGDKRSTVKYLAKIGNKVDLSVWSLDDFANASAWAK